MRKIWTTRDGKHIKIKDMSSSHIRNCIKMLQKHQSQVLSDMYCSLNFLSGEMAQFTCEQGIRDIEENGFDDESEDFIYSFEKELERRGEEI